jgi:hypothetical protein
LSGSAAVWFSPKLRLFNLAVGGWTGSSVDRSELDALLAGLHGILTWALANGYTEAGLTARPMMLHWTNDRESLVLSVARNPETGETFYKRKVNMDLWARFAYYEKLFRITACREDRNTSFLMALVDKLAGDQFAHFKAYVKLWPSVFSFFVDWLNYWEKPENINAEVGRLMMIKIRNGDLEEAKAFMDTRFQPSVLKLIDHILERPEMWRDEKFTKSFYIPT